MTERDGVEEGERSQFPITLRSSEPSLTPEVTVCAVRRYQDGWLAYPLAKTSRRFWKPPEGFRVPEGPLPRTLPLPTELYLRQLLDLDVTDSEAVIGFLETYGAILRTQSPVFEHQIYEGIGPVFAGRRAALEKKGHTFVKIPIPPAPEEYLLKVGAHRVQVEWKLRIARALVQHWLAAQEEGDVVTAWQAEGFGLVVDEAEAWQQFTLYMNVGLDALQVWFELPGYTPGLRLPDLFNGICSQLAFHIQENAIVQICEYQTCGRRFVRQLGGAREGQYQLRNVKYCSVRCAKNQAQREYRLRNKEKKNG